MSSNQIDDINYLGDPSLSKLESLYLNDNQISDISVLEQTTFKNLKDLQLCNNKIENIWGISFNILFPDNFCFYR